MPRKSTKRPSRRPPKHKAPKPRPKPTRKPYSLGAVQWKAVPGTANAFQLTGAGAALGVRSVG
jgi:hypothetical protein